MPVGDLFRLDGRVALVTGASSPIGGAICDALSEAGAQVVCAARNIAKGRRVAERLAARGGRAAALPLDLADEASILALHQATRQQVGPVDILVHNAMSQIPGHVERYARADWEASMQVDGTGYFQLTQLYLNDMLEAGRGNIITIASILGVVALDARLYPTRGGLETFRPNYSYAKAGMVAYSRFLAANYAHRNIRINCLSPGGVETEETGPDAAPFSGRTPMGRFATPDEMKGPVVFLASDASSYMTGQNLIVDGGYTAW